jgi:hypothetical protein
MCQPIKGQVITQIHTHGATSQLHCTNRIFHSLSAFSDQKQKILDELDEYSSRTSRIFIAIFFQNSKHHHQHSSSPNNITKSTKNTRNHINSKPICESFINNNNSRIRISISAAAKSNTRTLTDRSKNNGTNSQKNRIEEAGGRKSQNQVTLEIPAKLFVFLRSFTGNLAIYLLVVPFFFLSRISEPKSVDLGFVC